MELEGTDLEDLHPPDGEVEEDRLLDPRVRRPGVRAGRGRVGGGGRDAELAGVERGDRLLDGGGVPLVGEERAVGERGFDEGAGIHGVMRYHVLRRGHTYAADGSTYSRECGRRPSS